MAVLGTFAKSTPSHPEDRVRVILAALMALGLHIGLFQLMMFKTPVGFDVKEDIIAVELITLAPPNETLTTKENKPPAELLPLPPAPQVKPKPKPQAISPSIPPVQAVQTPDILASSRQAADADKGRAVPLSNMDASPSLKGRSESERRIDKGLKSLAADLSCMSGFAEDCADIRKDVFEEFQMTETDKVYTKKYAHTGMPVEFYGMSERQIRQKLNLKFAGENGLYIPFTNIGIDGGIWDALHGVNKGCEWKAGIDKGGNHKPIKDCPDYLPAAKEDRDRRNKFQRRAIK